MLTRPKPSTAAALIATVPELKSHLSIDFARDDDLLEMLLGGAQSYLEGPDGKIGRSFITREWVSKAGSLPVGVLELPFVDVQSVEITYLDEDSVEQTLSEDGYVLIEGASRSEVVFYRGFVEPKTADVPFPYTVTMTAGYGSAAEVPIAIKTAVLMIAASWRKNDTGMSEETGEIPIGVSEMIKPFRVVRV